MKFILSPNIDKKLKARNISLDDCMECFENRIGNFLLDTREEHVTDPPTQWFVAETHSGRILKIVFVNEGTEVYIKSAYDANETIQQIYARYS